MTTFIKTYHHIMLDKDPRMTKPMKEVYNFLLSYEETDSIKQVFPSTARIAEFTCNSPATVKRATKALQEIGLIKKTQRFNSTNIFQVLPYSMKGQTAHHEPSTNNADDIPDELDSSHSTVNKLTLSHDIAHHEPSDSSQRATIRSNNKIKKEDQLGEEEGESQGQGLSRDDDLHSPNVRIVEDGSDQIMSTEEEESNPVVTEVVSSQGDDYFEPESKTDSTIDDDEDYFESDDTTDLVDDEDIHHREQRSEERNQQITKHFSTQQQSTAPTREDYLNMMGANRVKQHKYNPAKPAWM